MTHSLGRFLRHSSHYSIGEILILLSTLVSFPITTRIFAVHEYGLMNLISNALLVLVACAKCGLQNSVVRYYNEYAEQQQPHSVRTFIASLLLGGLAVAAAFTVLWVVAATGFSEFWFGESVLPSLLLLSSALIFLRAGESLLLAFLRAEQQTLLFNGYRVLAKYATLAAILTTLFFIARTLNGFYGAQVFAMSLAFLTLLALRLRRTPLHWRDFAMVVFWQALAYGFPLIGFEFFSMLLAYSDRYLIHFFLDATAVGLYSASYNLADYLKDIVVLPFASAIMPVYMQTWAKKGKEETRKFLQSALRTYALFAAPLIFGCAAVGNNFIRVVASEKFVAGSAIIPWTIVGLMINGALPILAASHYIQKKTRRLVGILTGAMLVNLLGNWLLIPRLGILGAAIAKLASYLFMAVVVTFYTKRFLGLQLPWMAMSKYLAAGALMYLAVVRVHVATPLIDLLAETAVGIVVYFALVAVIDATFRQNLKTYLRRRLALLRRG
ncbi:MAG: oligosaccharide flippase family protein [candidate division KSB1 bacterium]|nr:oligosaccharide flippase family protein [candidate division KSB1 bacterium]MDZ7273636.1 oligosaccharide flippase family protein [candidate division KSB1 bacterium]MDZ7286773.1 oligosaccharide flippase family protein [candidate division KSB1 bacterium]MDZ7299870.1 oligosaccharide flippase family protein [candidate division KSB1 bacterium]MDZ7305807.1 oligosaccharide flippase family protein [candidate division KSB1 bacterium]